MIPIGILTCGERPKLCPLFQSDLAQPWAYLPLPAEPEKVEHLGARAEAVATVATVAVATVVLWTSRHGPAVLVIAVTTNGDFPQPCSKEMSLLENILIFWTWHGKGRRFNNNLLLMTSNIRNMDEQDQHQFCTNLSISPWVAFLFTAGHGNKWALKIKGPCNLESN